MSYESEQNGSVAPLNFDDLAELRRESVDDLSPAEQVLEDVSVSITLEDNFSLEAQILALHPADLADLFGFLSRDMRIELAESVGPLMDSETLTFLEGQVREDVLATFAPVELARVLGELETDDAVDLIEDIDSAVQQEVLTAVPAPDRRLIEDALLYPEESAGRLMSQDFVTMPIDWSVGQAIDYMRNTDDLPKDFYEIYILDRIKRQDEDQATLALKQNNLVSEPGHAAEPMKTTEPMHALEPVYGPVGFLSVSHILSSKRATKLANIMRTDLHPFAPELGQEEAAYEFRQYGLVSAPIVDEKGALLGVLTVDDMVHIMDEEAEDDLMKLAGLGSEADFFATAQKTVRARFPWLLINLATSILASLAIGLFSESLEKVVALAILMPIVASMGGNAGTQTLAIAIRAMATRDLTRTTTLKFIGKETLIGFINGLLFAVIVSVMTWLWFQDPGLGAVIGLAMIANMLVAAVGGAIIPLILDRFGVDPANASGVFLTTLTDVVGFVAFLGLAAHFIL